MIIRWQVKNGQTEQRLCMEWAEQGGPLVTPPSRKGFGSRLVERGLAAELGGSVQLAFPESGVVCAIDTPVPSHVVRES